MAGNSGHTMGKRIVICLTAILISSAAGIRITLTPNSLETKKTGDNIAVQCQLEDIAAEEQASVSTPSWVKVTDQGDETIPKNGRVSARQTGVNSLLMINAAVLSDAGEYKCVGGGLSAPVFVKLHSSVTFGDTPTEQHPIEGQDALIQCHGDGTPTPIISWSRNGHAIAINGGRYTLSEQRHLMIPGFQTNQDNGEYVCEAFQDSTGDRKELTINVVGYVAPSAADVALMNSEKWPRGVHEDAANVRIVCSSTGVPAPQFQWTKDGTVIQADDHFTFPQPGTLEIARVDVTDAGTYGCAAVNSVGDSKGELQVDVFRKAKISTINGPFPVQAQDDVSLECEFDGTQPIEASWTNLGNTFPSVQPEANDELNQNGKYVVIEQNKAILRIKSVSLEDAGEYQCHASNEAGTASKSFTLAVQKSPSIETFFPKEQIIRASLNSEYEFTCIAYAVPAATITWWKDEVPVTGEEGKVSITSHVGEDSNHVEGIMKLTVVSDSDFGKYECRAESSIAPAATKSFEVIKIEPPPHPELVCQDSRPTLITLLIQTYSATQEERYKPNDVIIRVNLVQDHSHVTTANLKFDPSGYYKIPDLEPSTAYIFNVTGANEAGSSEWAVIECKTPVPAPPGKPVFAQEQFRCNFTSECAISWKLEDTGGKRITGYKIEYGSLEDEEGGGAKEEVWVPAEQQSYTFVNLKPKTTYEVRVWAKNEEEEFSEVSITNVSTPEESVEKPADVFIGSGGGPGAGAVVATVLIIVLVIVILVDVACYYFNQCGVIMTICVNFCGKAPPESKAKDSKEAMMEGGGVGGGKETTFGESYEQKQPVKSEQIVITERGDVDGASESTTLIAGQNGHKEKRDTTV